MEAPKETKVIVPESSVERVVIDLDTGNCAVTWSDGKIEKGIIIELVYGQQGTWMRIALDSEPDKTLCVGQSGRMDPVCFFYDEPPIIPNNPPIIISEEELSGKFTVQTL